MGKVKVKDGAPAKAVKVPSRGGSAPGVARRLGGFLLNLVSGMLYKPVQGWNARMYTAVGLGVVAALGLYRLHESLADSAMSTRYGVPALAGLALAWVIFRLVQYPPFVEFLIATEAEMNKVSWTSREDLTRATTVVLATVTLMSVFLFGVDWVWSSVLQLLGVLKFDSGGAFGSSAG